MSTLDSPPERLRWPRTHKFNLSTKGREAETEYRERIAASRDHSGRASFDAARTAWATAWKLQSEDGLYLSEMVSGSATLPQLLTAMLDSGQTRKDVLDALARLDDAGMFEHRQLIG